MTNTLKTLCTKFVERSTYLGLNGKRRDDDAVTFFAGAVAALQALDHPDTNHVGSILALVIATRGYSEVERIAKGA